MSYTFDYDCDEFQNILRNIRQEPVEILHDNQMGEIRWEEEFRGMEVLIETDN